MILLKTVVSSNRNHNFLKVEKAVSALIKATTGRRCIPFSTDMRAAMLKETRIEHLSVSWKSVRKDYSLYLNK